MPIAKITQENIDNMTSVRKSEILADAPDLKQENFASEAEYREALMKNYETLRQKEYELTVQNECMKVYNLAKDGRALGINENAGVWNGYRSYTNAARISAAEKERRTQQVQDCAISRAPKMGGICMNNRPNASITSNNSCAITAAALTAQISAKMGYDDKDNLMQAKYRGANPSLKNNLVAAQGVAQCDSIPDQYKKTIRPISKINPKTKKKVTATPTLNELIANGTIGVGDAFAVKTARGATNTSTGYHALTVAAIQKDENGNVTGYTLQANNNCRFSTHSIKEKSLFGNSQVYNAANTHAWMDDKIKTETKELSNLSTQELEEKLASQKQKTLSLADDLQKTESYAAKKNYCQNIADNYVLTVNKKTELMNQTALTPEQTQTPIPTNDNTPLTPTDRQTLKEELKAQTATLSENKTAHFKDGHVAAVIDTHDNKKQLNTPDTRDVKTAMHEDRVAVGLEPAAQPATPPRSNSNSAAQEAKKEPQRENQPHKEAPEIPLKNIIAAYNRQGR